MSVVQEFCARRIHFSDEARSTYIIDEYGKQLIFPFTFHCKFELPATGNRYAAFFDMVSGKCLFTEQVLWSDVRTKYTCKVLGFHVRDDLPILSARLFLDMHLVMDVIAEEFKDKYASYVLDCIVNS